MVAWEIAGSTSAAATAIRIIVLFILETLLAVLFQRSCASVLTSRPLSNNKRMRRVKNFALR
jgi:hypothetical protein